MFEKREDAFKVDRYVTNNSYQIMKYEELFFTRMNFFSSFD